MEESANSRWEREVAKPATAPIAHSVNSCTALPPTHQQPRAIPIGSALPYIPPIGPTVELAGLESRKDSDNDILAAAAEPGC
jgi:hypothetical protein